VGITVAVGQTAVALLCECLCASWDFASRQPWGGGSRVRGLGNYLEGKALSYRVKLDEREIINNVTEKIKNKINKAITI